MLIEKLTILLRENNISLPENQINLLVHYVELLAKWNKTYNLTAIRNPKDMLTKHIIDSLVVSTYLEGKQFADVGTGAGLPGIPLAIVNPAMKFTLIDSLSKRIHFINHVKSELGLSNVQLILARVETLKNQVFDGVISRAFASLSDMLNLTNHLTGNYGKFYALKGRYPKDELRTLPNRFVINRIVKFTIPSMQADRHLIIIEKVN